MLKKITIAIIAGTFVGWIAWDIYLASHGAETESQILASWGRATTLFPFILGLLCGHWFLNQRQILRSAWGFALPIMGALGLFDIAWAIWGTGHPWFRYPLVYIILGMGTGAAVWAQQDDSSPMP